MIFGNEIIALSVNIPCFSTQMMTHGRKKIENSMSKKKENIYMCVNFYFILFLICSKEMAWVFM